MLSGSCHCGAVTWTFEEDPGSVTACNCTVCRRYGALWIYGWEDEGVSVSGLTRSYARGRAVTYHFCPTCGCLVYYRGAELEEDGRRKMVVNLRMIDNPMPVSTLPIDHFDGFDTFEDLPRDSRRVVDMWF